MTVDETLTLIWARVLGADDVGIHDRFFDLGGDAVTAADMLSLVRDALDVDIELSSFLEDPTISGLSSLVESRLDAGEVLPRAGVAPLAFSQEGMLWHERLAPGSFNLPPLVRRYQGGLSFEALRQSLHDLVARHAPLRTTFHVVDGHPLQQIAPTPPPALPLTDLSHLEAVRQQAELARVIADSSSRPFDLATGPLFEPHLYQLGEQDHVLVIRLHHLAFDDWSVDVFRHDLSALYAAHAAGQPPPLAELAIDFPTYCRDQRRTLALASGARELTYWKRELSGAPLTLQLPIADPARPRGSPHPAAAAIDHPLPPGLVRPLRDLARRQRTTLYMALLAVFAVVAHGYTGQDDLLMASVVANRNDSALEGLIGCFTKKVLVRLRLSGDPSFVEVLSQARRAMLGALDHQDLPFETVLQQALGPVAASHGLVPDVSVMFQAEAPRRQRLLLPGLSTSGLDAGAATQQPHFAAGDADQSHGDPPIWGDGLYQATFLILSVLEAGEDVSLVARGVFHTPGVLGLLTRFEAVLGDLVTRPAARLSTLAYRGERHAHSGSTVDLYGFDVDPGRIEAAVARCRNVGEVAVAVIAGGGAAPVSQLVAYIVPTDAGRPPPTLAQVRDHLWAEIPGYAWPAAIVVVGAIPRLGDGRVDISGLPAPDPPREKPGPATAHEEGLTGLWSEVLGGGPVSADANYWQRFSFLEVVDRAGERDIAIGAARVRRNRTLRALAADASTIQLAPGDG